MFYVGQKVVCVNDDPDNYGRPVIVVKGQVYTVSRAFDWLGVRALLFVEVSPGGEPGWCASRFRPVVERKTDISIFTAMLNPSDKRVEA